MRWLCRLIGHQALDIVTPEIESYVGGGYWRWPGCITICPRCRMLYRRHDDEKDRPHRLSASVSES